MRRILVLGGILLISFLLTAGFFSAPAFALATASSAALIDWSTLSWDFDNSVMVLIWNELGSSAEAWAYYNALLMSQDYDDSLDWEDAAAAAAYSTGNGNAEGDAYTNDETLASYSAATSDAGGNFAGDAAAYRWGYFGVNGNGTITFTVNYSLEHELNETNPRPYDMATAFTSAGLYLENLTQGNFTDSGAAIWTPSWDPPLNGVKSDSGTLSISWPFADGDVGFLRAGVTSPCQVNSTAIPEPATLSLLGLGLLGLVKLKKKVTTVSEGREDEGRNDDSSE